jgi:predicted phage baseplate assembly protein
VKAVEAVAVGGTVGAEHAEDMPREVVGRSNGAPAQTFTVTRTPVLPRREGEHVVVSGPDGVEDWVEVEDFTASTESDNHYVWDSGSGTITFGPRVRYPDGSVRQHGRVPRDGSQIYVTGYRAGGGGRGNVGAGTLTVLRSTVPFIRDATNLAAATGGVDAETVEEAKVRAPMTVRTGHRAVTARDYERLSLESSIEVARTRCLPAASGNGAVRLLVVPRVRSEAAAHRLDDFAISAPLMSTISGHLDKHRLVGTSVQIGTPYYQGVSVAALVHARAGRPAGMVRQRASAAITTYLNPLVGGPDGTGWPFDADVNAAALAQLLEAIDGVDRVEEVLLYEYDLRSGHRLGAAKDVIRLDQHSLFLAAKPQVVVR